MYRTSIFFSAAAALLLVFLFSGVHNFSDASGEDNLVDSDGVDRRTLEDVDRRDGRRAAEAPSKALRREEVYGADAVDFSVQFGDHVIPYSVFGVYVMPREEVDLRAVLARTPGEYNLEVSGGSVAVVGADAWQWRAPESPGVYTLEVRDVDSGSTVRLNAFVLTPCTADTRELNGYRIGAYEKRPLNGKPIYRPPAGFVEFRPEHHDVKVSPHFTLGQFVAKQKSGYPKYLLLREPLLLKLEMLVSEVNQMGIAANTLYIMSGYRTPHYNRSIGNQTNYSRHLYGGAADVFVDTDEDGYMDDLSGDGRVDVDDARLLARIVEEHAGADWYRPFVGGLGIYPKNSVRGPFIHVDVRGQKARW